MRLNEQILETDNPDTKLIRSHISVTCNEYKSYLHAELNV